MVRIEEKPLEERVAEDNCSKLLVIAKEMFGGNKRVERLGRMSVYVGNNNEIMVQTIARMIFVKSPDVLDDAVRLARAYERLLGGKEVVVQKNY